VSWNVGDDPASPFRGRAEFFFAVRGWALPGHQTEAFLAPGDAAPAPGTAIVLHLDGEIVGHGHVVGRRLPEAE
jgi:hypothetical protein